MSVGLSLICEGKIRIKNKSLTVAEKYIPTDCLEVPDIDSCIINDNLFN